MVPAGGDGTHLQCRPATGTNGMIPVGSEEAVCDGSPPATLEQHQRPRLPSVPRMGSGLGFGFSLGRQGSGEVDSVLGEAVETLAGAEGGYGEETRAPAESTMEGVSISERLFERGSLMYDSRVRLLLFTYGLYTVGRLESVRGES